MYSGNNPSALRSQKWIKDALLALIEEKPYRKISVKEITERSDLARQTFYQLFESKDEIIEYHLDNLFHAYIAELKALQDVTVEDVARLYFAFFQNHARFIEKLIENDLLNIMNRKFHTYLTEVQLVLQYAQSSRYSEYEVAFISSGLIGILVHWFSTNRALSIDELAQMVGGMLHDRDHDTNLTKMTDLSKTE